MFFDRSSFWLINFPKKMIYLHFDWSIFKWMLRCRHRQQERYDAYFCGHIGWKLCTGALFNSPKNSCNAQPWEVNITIDCQTWSFLFFWRHAQNLQKFSRSRRHPEVCHWQQRQHRSRRSSSSSTRSLRRRRLTLHRPCFRIRCHRRRPIHAHPWS